MIRLRLSVLLFCLASAPAWARTCHYSWWSDNPSPYLDAIRKAHPAVPPSLAPGERVRAGIVTHHFLANALMVRFFATLRAGSSPETLILIGPNHFHHGSANISVSSLPWKTPFGIMETDQRIVQQVRSVANLPEDPEAFTGEHSVGVLIPFLKYYFPRSRVVPVLVDVNSREDQLKELRPLFAEFLANPQLLVVLSMDFSHDSVSSVADARDDQAQEAILDLDTAQVRKLSVDCRGGLWLFLASLRDLGRVKAQVDEHTNSARLTGKPGQVNVTSYFTMFFIK
ncbi:MAG TPA: AmmeMemoRadiSam system protein B [Terriglobia bacterium]|nr:AmmeMemoRadiSam system protein B [Terriglobia bacterium]